MVHKNAFGETGTASLEQMASEKVSQYIGIELEPKEQRLLEAGIGQAIPYVRRFVQQHVGKALSAGLKAVGKDVGNESTVRYVRDGVGYAVAALPQLIGITTTVKENLADRKALKKQFADLPKSARSGNFIIQEAYASSRASMFAELKEQFFSLGVAAPQFWLTYHDNKLNQAYEPLSPTIDTLFKGENPNLRWDSTGYAEKKAKFTEEFIKELHTDSNESMRTHAEMYDRASNVVATNKATIERWNFIITPAIRSAISWVTGKKEHETKKPVTEYIQELATEIKKHPGQEVIHVWGERTALEDAIFKIFSETHERRYGKDDALPPQRMHAASAKIASAILSDGLPVEALIELAGQSNVVLNKQGDIADDAALDALLEGTLKSYGNYVPLDVSLYTRDTDISREDLQALYDEAKDQPEQLAMLASVFPVEVSMEMSGKSRSEVRSLTRRNINHVAVSIEQAAAEMIRMDDDQLRDLGLNARDVENVRNLEVTVKMNGRAALTKALEDKDGKPAELKTAIGKILTERNKTEGGFAEKFAPTVPSSFTGQVAPRGQNFTESLENRGSGMSIG